MVLDVLLDEKITVLEFNSVLQTPFGMRLERPDRSLESFQHKFPEKYFLDRLKNYIYYELRHLIHNRVEVFNVDPVLFRYLVYRMDLSEGIYPFEVEYDLFPGSIKIEDGKIVLDYKLCVVIAGLWVGSISFFTGYPSIAAGFREFSKDLSTIAQQALDGPAEDVGCRVESITISRADPEKVDALVAACLRKNSLNDYHELRERIQAEMKKSGH
jgi:hypothetical protein